MIICINILTNIYRKDLAGPEQLDLFQSVGSSIYSMIANQSTSSFLIRLFADYTDSQSIYCSLVLSPASNGSELVKLFLAFKIINICRCWKMGELFV